MSDTDRTLAMYLHLARASHVRRQAMVRDKLLVLAGVQAQEMGLDPIAWLCRQKILAHNARHLIRRLPTITAALADEQFQPYLKQLKRRYSPEKIEHMLASLGIELGRERDAYFNDLEYATALLAAVPERFARAEASLAKHGAWGQPPTRAGKSEPDSRPGKRALVDRLVVWGPFVVGLVVLVLRAILARFERS
jgi:hypothetical protein